jgi:hypothetical protein
MIARSQWKTAQDSRKCYHSYRANGSRRNAVSKARYWAFGLAFTQGDLSYHYGIIPRMPPYTRGFESIPELRRHFTEHGDDFRASNTEEYEEWADAFLGGAKPSGVHECRRSCGYMIRYDPQTEAFGVLDSGGIIRTYFKPRPCSSVPLAIRDAVKQAGRCHKYPDNLVYFHMECRK